MENEKVYKFANKWKALFCDRNTVDRELCGDIAFADECRDLGFEMDCGQSFEEAFPGTRALNDWRNLQNVIESVNDIHLLGSAIFSQWRYFNHWAGPGESITSEDNRQWFIVAFNRMIELTDNISNPEDRKDDLLDQLSEYDVDVRINKSSEEGSPDEQPIEMEVLNPRDNGNLIICLGKDFALKFWEWEMHYPATEQGYDDFKDDVFGILKGKYGILSAYSNECLCDSMILKEQISHRTKPWSLVLRLNLSRELMQSIREYGADILVKYWKPNDCYEFELSERGKPQPEYTFPRRYGVRFILKDDVCIGSGSRKAYDPETAFITGYYIEPEYDSPELERMLIGILEDDARKANEKRIFANIDDEETDLFSSMGYKEVPIINDERVLQLSGADVIFSKTMMKML